jgi:hypothetical protein
MVCEFLELWRVLQKETDPGIVEVGFLTEDARKRRRG